MKIIAANLKTNHTRSSVGRYINEIAEYIANEKIQDRCVVFPPATALGDSTIDITIGAQNAYPVANGSFTGEIGCEQLEEFGTTTILIGHSERRHILGEGLDLIKKKFDFFSKKGYEIFFCIGEPLEVKESGFEAVMNYINHQIAGIDLEYEKLVIAYEPVWAIGTGKSASVDDIREIHAAIRELSSKPILYGGSVKVENVQEILSIPNVDGVLVGTTSWKSENYCALLNESKQLKDKE